MSHKEIWNMIVHSSEMFEWGHPLHDLDVMAIGCLGFLFILVVAAMVDMECRSRRDDRESVSEYRRWLRQWRNLQKKGRNHG